MSISTHISSRMSIKSTRSFLLLLLATLSLLPSVFGCSCMSPGDTGAERADYVRNSDWVDLVVVATFTNETSYSTDDEDDWGGLDYQNTTFIVKEILYQRDTNIQLQNFSSIDVQPDGTMVVTKSTVTTCCLCGRSLSADTIGSDYLLEIAQSSDTLSQCGVTCQMGEDLQYEMGICDDTADALRDDELVDNVMMTQ